MPAAKQRYCAARCVERVVKNTISDSKLGSVLSVREYRISVVFSAGVGGRNIKVESTLSNERNTCATVRRDIVPWNRR